MKLRVIAALAVLAIGAVPASASADPIHVVKRGETLTSIAARDGLTVSALAAANGLSPEAELLKGQILHIPARNGQTESTTTTGAASTGTVATGTKTAVLTGTETSTAQASGRTYVVRWGNTLTAIAARYGTTVTALARLNGLRVNGILLEGRDLEIPTTSTSTQYVSDTSSSSATTSTSQTTASTSTTATAETAGPYPTDQSVTGAEIASIADANGVPAAFAEAIGWQESGWNNDAVSSIGAVGVMQLVPTTWTWVDQYLTPSDPLGPSSASENVRAGVLLLHDLLSLTGNNEGEAAAGYYQGLGSVAAHGEYASTKQYVADVLALAQRFGG